MPYFPPSKGGGGVATVTAADGSITVAGTANAPTVKVTPRSKFLLRSAGSFDYSLAVWGDMTNLLDLSVAAAVGDTLEYTVNGLWDNNAVQGGLDVATIVAGAPVNFFSGGQNNATDGIAGWVGLPNVFSKILGSAFYVVQAGDIAAGRVTCRLRRKNTTAALKQIFAIANDPLTVGLKNLGPQAA